MAPVRCADTARNRTIWSIYQVVTQHSAPRQTGERMSAIVVRFSRSRKRYERQGILIEESALKQTEAVADPRARGHTATP
jgi:hypothetical protein